MNLFRGVLVIAWALLAFITWRAITLLGSDGSYIFLDDFTQPWRAQFYTDFIIHVMLVASWVWWRESSKVAGVLWALACIGGGALVTLLYVFITTYRVDGDARKLLLGKHA
jgi:uncharacterized protein DUF1475